MRVSIFSIFIILAISIPAFSMGSVNVRFVSVDPKVNNAGIHNIQIGDSLVPAFSIDPLDTHIPGTIFSSSEILPLQDAPDSPYGPMGEDKALQLHQLLSAYWADSLTDNEGAALQLAVWEIVAEQGITGYNLSLGEYIATGSPVAQGQWYLDNFASYGGPLSSFVAISCYLDDVEGSTDYVIRVPASVPAPEAIGLCGFGILIINIIRRRRMG